MPVSDNTFARGVKKTGKQTMPSHLWRAVIVAINPGLEWPAQALGPAYIRPPPPPLLT